MDLQIFKGCPVDFTTMVICGFLQDHGSVLDEGTGRSQGHSRYQHRELPEVVHWRSMDPQLVERGHFAVVKKLTSQLRVSLDVTHSLSPRLSATVFLLGRTRQRAVPRATARSLLDWRRFVCPQHIVGDVKLISPSFTKCVSIHCVRTRCSMQQGCTVLAPVLPLSNRDVYSGTQSKSELCVQGVDTRAIPVADTTGSCSSENIKIVVSN